MSDFAVPDLFAPEGGWRVRILDLSGANAEDGNVVEEIAGFPTLMHANAFARAYVRDSVERCRGGGGASRGVLEAWLAFGEDAEVVDAGEAGFRSAAEIGDFADNPAAADDRNWRALDPRRHQEEEDDSE